VRLDFVCQEFLGNAFQPDQSFIHGYKYEPALISFAKKLKTFFDDTDGASKSDSGAWTSLITSVTSSG
jgi:hypothetical protein